ncbi:MAG: TetR/AcrR family transcriptional regulator [Acidobacteriaceae bacterium]|nr:TetR/AcrR family transcriptional regulator [Acidobacteriaceae bacterium]
MSPRAYNLGKRQASADETRSRILEAARKLLADEASPADFSMETIARAADVSRLTIYYQFKSRPGLLEALYDHLAGRGNMRQMGQVFHEPDPSMALQKLIRTFVDFWSSDPVVIRRLRAMGALDAEIGAGIRARDSRRVHAAGEILRRIALSQRRKYRPEQRGSIPDTISMLTSFEAYDSLSRAGHSDENIVKIVLALAQSAITRR